MEQLVIIILLILVSGDVEGYTKYDSSKEAHAARQLCMREVPKEYRHRYNQRDMWVRQCKERKLRKAQEVKP